MAFFECEALPRRLGFQRVGGPTFNTAVVAVQSGQEQRNRNWSNPRAEYQATLLTDPFFQADTSVYIEAVRTAFYMVAGMADGFRFYDHLDCVATNEPMVLSSGSVWQLQKTYTLAGRTYVRTITKPIMSSVKNYQGTALPDTVTIVSGGTLSSVDQTTGLVTLTGVSGTPHASFQYHIPVRLQSDKFEPEVQPSDVGNDKAIIKWHSLSLIEVRPPNY